MNGNPKPCGFTVSYATTNAVRKMRNGEPRYHFGDACQNPNTHEVVRNGKVEARGCWIHAVRYARQFVGYESRRIRA